MRLLCFTILFSLFSTLSYADGTRWAVEIDKSRLAFVFMQEGKVATGEFKKFDAEMQEKSTEVK